MKREEAARRIAVRVVSSQEYEDFKESHLTEGGRLKFEASLKFGRWLVDQILAEEGE